MNKGNKREMKGRAELHGTLMNCANENKPIKKSINVLAIINFSRLDMKKVIKMLLDDAHSLPLLCRAQKNEKEKSSQLKNFLMCHFSLSAQLAGEAHFSFIN